ncbi:type II toxin-antitoxin system HicA family toxin, partial [Desulfosporosinus sp. OT]|uniref:type II toxin-antitoxin system HicA family toxin n=1 Tax=Desulfosporosinus sp. OT TaxID=913865 RepID=UPI0002239FEA
MKSFSSNEILKILKEEGWVIKEQTSSHAQFKHATKKGKVTVPHPQKDLSARTIQSIF